MKNNKGISPIYIVLIVLVLSALSFGIYKFTSKTEAVTKSKPESKNELVTYTNEELKIKFHYPKNIHYLGAECGDITIPLKIDHKEGSNIIFIYPASSPVTTPPCTSKELTADEALNYSEGYYGLRLKVADFKTTSELEKIINSADKYGVSKCSIEKMGMNPQGKFKSPIMKNPTTNQGMGDCLTWPGRFNIKVNQDENRVVLETFARQQSQFGYIKNVDIVDFIFDSIEFLK